MSGLINFRDFGGLATRDGRTVRRDRLYRSGHLSRLCDAERARLMDLDFAVIADLRDAGERALDPSPWPEASQIRIVAASSDHHAEAPHLALLRSGTLSSNSVDSFYHHIYATVPLDPHYQRLFAAAINRIAGTDGRVLIHCSAGKDRTGILVCLILHCLGVPTEAIIDEYLRSSKAPGLVAMKPKILASIKHRHGLDLPEQAVDMLLDVRREYLEVCLLTIERSFGSVDHYLGAIGVGVQQCAALRQRFLTPQQA
jgi:protein-tyrosine phosphatase